MDVHIYKDGKYIQTERNIKPCGKIDLEGDPSKYKFLFEGQKEYPESNRLAVPKNPVYWPEGSEL